MPMSKASDFMGYVMLARPLIGCSPAYDLRQPLTLKISGGKLLCASNRHAWLPNRCILMLGLRADQLIIVCMTTNLHPNQAITTIFNC